MFLNRVLNVILGIILAFCGVYLVMSPGITFLALGMVAGISMIINAIVFVIFWFRFRDTGIVGGFELFIAILLGLLGLFVIYNGFAQVAVDWMILLFTSIGFLVGGIRLIVNAFKIRRLNNEGVNTGFKWGWVLVGGILLTIAGVLGLMYPANLAVAIGFIVGLEIIFSGIALIAAGFFLE